MLGWDTVLTGSGALPSKHPPVALWAVEALRRRSVVVGRAHPSRRGQNQKGFARSSIRMGPSLQIPTGLSFSLWTRGKGVPDAAVGPMAWPACTHAPPSGQPADAAQPVLLPRLSWCPRLGQQPCCWPAVTLHPRVVSASPRITNWGAGEARSAPARQRWVDAFARCPLPR